MSQKWDTFIYTGLLFYETREVTDGYLSLLTLCDGVRYITPLLAQIERKPGHSFL